MALRGGSGNALFKVAASAVVGGVGSELQGGNFLSGFLSGGVSGGLGASGFFAGDFDPGKLLVSAAVGGFASKLGGGKFGNGALTGAFAYSVAHGVNKLRDLKPTYSEGEGGTAFVGGFFDKTIDGPVIRAYRNYNGDKAYFQWYEKEALARWIDANGGNVSVIGHSYGAEVVAAGHSIHSLRTVDPVGWIRPNFADVASNAGTWVNYNAIGGGATWSNFVAGIGGAWNDAPSGYAIHRRVNFDHLDVCLEYCSP